MPTGLKRTRKHGGVKRTPRTKLNGCNAHRGNTEYNLGQGSCVTSLHVVIVTGYSHGNLDLIS